MELKDYLFQKEVAGINITPYHPKGNVHVICLKSIRNLYFKMSHSLRSLLCKVTNATSQTFFLHSNAVHTMKNCCTLG